MLFFVGGGGGGGGGGGRIFKSEGENARPLCPSPKPCHVTLYIPTFVGTQLVIEVLRPLLQLRQGGGCGQLHITIPPVFLERRKEPCCLASTLHPSLAFSPHSPSTPISIPHPFHHSFLFHPYCSFSFHLSFNPSLSLIPIPPLSFPFNPHSFPFHPSHSFPFHSALLFPLSSSLLLRPSQSNVTLTTEERSEGKSNTTPFSSLSIRIPFTESFTWGGKHLSRAFQK